MEKANLRNRFGQNLRRLRRQNGLTQEQLAEAADISVDFLSLVERGKNGPSFDSLANLAEALNLTVQELFDFGGSADAKALSTNDPEALACRPQPLDPQGFNPAVRLPYNLALGAVRQAMQEFLDFLGFLNPQLHQEGIKRFESMLMPANFSSMVGEFMISSIPRFSPALVANLYHNGHPDLIPAGMFPDDAIQYAQEGIEVKASRYQRGWQGHNPEDSWLMVFVFDSNRPVDVTKGVPPKPFRFIKVIGAQLRKEDWKYSGRSRSSRRTITASVTNSGFERMEANWLYREATLRK